MIQARDLLLQTPFGIIEDAIVQKQINNQEILDNDPLFGENGNINQFLKGPDKENKQKKERKFEYPDRSSDGIQALIKVRK